MTINFETGFSQDLNANLAGRITYPLPEPGQWVGHYVYDYAGGGWGYAMHVMKENLN